MLQPGKDRTFVSYSITRAFLSFVVRAQLNLYSETVPLWGHRLTRLQLMGTTRAREPTPLVRDSPLLTGGCTYLSAFHKPGPFYFTRLLLPALFKASSPENKSRVVNTSSAGGIAAISYFGSGLDFATFKDSPRRRKYSSINLYGQSKFVRPKTTNFDVIGKAKTPKPTRGTSCLLRNWPGGMATKSRRLRSILVSPRGGPPGTAGLSSPFE